MKQRYAYFDNAKLLLIFLVVFGHIIENTLFDNHFWKSVFLFIYYFHMPAFVLLSGFFAKNFTITYKKNIKRLLAYYIVFEVLYFPAFYTSGYIFILPYYSLWYLLSLVTWYLLLHVFTRLKHPILVSIVFAVLIGYLDCAGWYLSLSRTFVFFPFFIAGYYMREKDFFVKATPLVKISAITILLSIFYMIYAGALDISKVWLTGDKAFSMFGHSEWYAGIYRIGVFALSSLICFCFFILVPRKRNALTYMGKNTLNTYLLHGFVALAISRYQLFENMNIYMSSALVIIISVLTVALFSSNAADNVIKPLFDRIMKIPLPLRRKRHTVATTHRD